MNLTRWQGYMLLLLLMYDFTNVTELPGSWLTTEQVARLQQRYAFARQMAQGRRVLEVSCGAGLGLSLLSQSAQWVVAGDYTYSVLSIAQRQPNTSTPLICFDAQSMPIASASIDLVVNFEAIYYYSSPMHFFDECRRVLASDGTLLIGSDNPHWKRFAPGPLSSRYLSLVELRQLACEAGFRDVRCFGGFADVSGSTLHTVRSSIRQWVTATGLFEKLPAIREWLKPLVYRNMQMVDSRLLREIDGYEPVVELDRQIDSQEETSRWRVIYLLATQP